MFWTPKFQLIYNQTFGRLLKAFVKPNFDVIIKTERSLGISCHPKKKF
jgi:hypothetical protein